MIQVGDLVKHRHIGGLGLVMSTTTDTKRNHQAKIQWLINLYKGGDIHRPMDKTTRKIGDNK